MSVVDEKRQSGELPPLECSCPLDSVDTTTTAYNTEIPTGIAPTESSVYSSGIVDNSTVSQTTDTGGISSEGWLRDLHAKIKEEADRILAKDAEYKAIQEMRYGVKQEADYSGLISAEDFLNDPANAHYFDMVPVTDNATTDAENKAIVE